MRKRDYHVTEDILLAMCHVDEGSTDLSSVWISPWMLTGKWQSELPLQHSSWPELHFEKVADKLVLHDVLNDL